MREYTGHIENLRWASVDFDGVLSESVWPDRGIGDPIEKNIKKLGELVVAGFEPVIHTARPWSDYEDLAAWLAHHEIPYHAMVCGKLLAAKYIDDKAINSEKDSWL